MLTFIAQIVGPETVQVDWFEQLQQGGIVVIVQGLLVIALIAISLERMYALRLKRFSPVGFTQTMLRLASNEDYSTMESRCQKENHTLARVIAFALHHGTSSPNISDNMQDIAQREIETEYEKLASLSLIAAAAPLLGLLGTMIGMIESFQLVALYGDEGGASMLAGSIAKALITTAVGLIIALPALFLHHTFKRKLQKISKSLEANMEALYLSWFLGTDRPEAQPEESAPSPLAETPEQEATEAAVS
ncbi:MotA/TolQ/ExbB proton channel family protein [Cerasicoccus arenae]|uniref:MotA/TolQ/ExbB proton channel domain-containing protein n=1 Tax=Cerasicoccus arenae TaxID=424488 RepID=A0A8J3DCF8_9BACT|nr:MotA/TolQ/ExbB proton channel family protein [Cerasicoccus arenae]MBK1859226.1 MotA/TolQ/ExbB proton channel family protein [Cerasicoccus arenae]GHC02721.1 hypothetical protein GCM10007047_19210 [Cerasicoccus arenae]